MAKSTIANFELEKNRPYDRTLADLQKVIESAGVEFIPENGGGAGVRLRKLAPDDHETIAARIVKLDAKADALKHDGTPSPDNALKTMDRALAKGRAKGLRKRLAKDAK